MRRTAILSILALALAGCFGARRQPGDLGSPGPASSGPRATRFEASTATATLTVGTEVVRGVVSRWCQAGDCTTVSGAKPAGRVLVESGSVIATIAMEREPLEVTGVVREGSKIVSTTVLRPRTLVAWKLAPRVGMQQLRIIARWRDAETTWIFAMQRTNQG